MSDNSEGLMPGLAELCRIHDVSLELIRRSDDVDELLDAVLAEYEKRLKEMSADTVDGTGRPLDPDEARKLQALVMFAGQAVALKEKAAAATQLRKRAEELERVLDQEARTRQRLDDLLAALDAGIMLVGGDGRIQNVNRAASNLTGEPTERLVGRPAQPYLGKVDRRSDGKVSDSSKVMLVARRDLRSEPEAEVVLLSDVTVHEREAEERHRLEKFAELLKTLGVLSHKINNPLTSLMGRAQILRMKEETDPDVRKAAEVIEDSAKRIAAYIRELALVVKDGKEEALRPLLDMEAPVPSSRIEKP